MTSEEAGGSSLTTVEIQPSSPFFPWGSDSVVTAEALRLRSDFFALRLELLPDDRILSTISRVLELRGRDVGEPSVRKEGR